MEGLNRIIERIASDTEQDAAALLTHAQEDAHEKLLHYQAIAKKRLDHLLTAGKIEAQELVLRTNSAAELDARKTLLTVKQELVSSVFEEALEALASLSSEEYRSFLIRMAYKASLTGSEEVLLNSSDLQTHGAAIKEGANRMLSSAGKNAALTLSPEVHFFSGGLILKNGQVETNCTLEVLVKQARNTMTSEVAKVLFNQ